jgi:hypothetical protein
MEEETRPQNTPMADFARFSRLHAWYNHLPPEGQPFLIFPWRGQQPCTHFDPQVDDTEGIHWWAWDSRDISEIPISGVGKDIIMRHPVYFNCALRGVETNCIKGIAVIERHWPDYEATLRQEYPYLGSLERVFQLERTRQLLKAEFTAQVITALFEEQCPAWLRGVEDTTPPPAQRPQRTGLFRRSKSAHKVKK